MTNERLEHCTMQICQNLSGIRGDIFTLTCGNARQPITLFHKTPYFAWPYRFIASHLVWAGHSRGYGYMIHRPEVTKNAICQVQYSPWSIWMFKRLRCRDADDVWGGEVSCFECIERWHQCTKLYRLNGQIVMWSYEHEMWTFWGNIFELGTWDVNLLR
jgi:hypothetical protein